MSQHSEFPFLEASSQPASLGKIGHFEVSRLLGEGGMGYVFEALDVRLRRVVALKVIKPHVAKKQSHLDQFLTEARSMASVSHRNVVTIYDVGSAGRYSFLAMERLKGETLADRMSSGVGISTEESLRWIAEVCEGLQAAHDVGIVHRDVKPSNLWIDEADQSIKILDFGLARDLKASEIARAGLLAGTPHYLSPEQARGEAVSFRSDLYSVGVTFYQLLSGQLPHDESTRAAQLAAIVVKRPIPISERVPGLPAALHELVDGLLAKRPADRPDSAITVARRLTDYRDALQGSPGISQFESPKLRGPQISVHKEERSETKEERTDTSQGGNRVHFPTWLAASITLVLLTMSFTIVTSWILPADSVVALGEEFTSFAMPERDRPVEPFLTRPRERRIVPVAVENGFFEVGSTSEVTDAQATVVSIRNQPGVAHVRSIAVMRFEIGDAQPPACVDVALRMTLKGGASSNGKRTLRVFAVERSADEPSPMTFAKWQELKTKRIAVDLGQWVVDNRGYRFNDRAGALTFSSSAFVEFIRQMSKRDLVLMVERSDRSNGQTQLHADLEKQELRPTIELETVAI
ncbi:MAG: serine/threonine-protein kinase [Planctomycetota bacterium]